MQQNASAKGSAYGGILSAARSVGRITYGQFDELILNRVGLFDVPDDEYLIVIEQTLDRIISALPAFKRIFARPIIRLTDAREIVPIEAVKVIDNQSLMHVAARSELWDDVTARGIKPRKLLTTEAVETYTIYENIAFVYAVDTVLSFVRQTAMLFKDITYGSRDLHFNLLDRTHHNQYFLAIGKLHLEYSTMRASRSDWSRCIDKLLFVDKTLRGKLHAPVYQKCKKARAPIKLKKTNIFRSHKDYATVYNLLKHFEGDLEQTANRSIAISPDADEYKAFCGFLTLFAAGHFHFTFDPKTTFDPMMLNVACRFCSWTLRIRRMASEVCDGLLLSVTKDKEYRIYLAFCDRARLSQTELAAMKAGIFANEYLFCSASAYGEREVLYLSVYDVDSFRRIQQLLLRAMLYSDEQREVCPFCGYALDAIEEGHECPVCRGQILERICPDTGRPYLISRIKPLRTKAGVERVRDEKRRFLHDREQEAQLHFRNIGPLSADGTPACPRCGKYHP